MSNKLIGLSVQLSPYKGVRKDTAPSSKHCSTLVFVNFIYIVLPPLTSMRDADKRPTHNAGNFLSTSFLAFLSPGDVAKFSFINYNIACEEREAMIDVIKTKIWEILKEKAVSLAMVYDREGRILWHKGRKITGRTIHEGEGFSKSFVKKSLESREGITKENVFVASAQGFISESAVRLLIRSVLIYPITGDLFLYVDSGRKDSFDSIERNTFKMLGDMLAETVKQIRREQESEGGIIGSSEEMDNIKKLVLKYSLVEEPIFLKGETGAGKNHMAEQIHRYSGRPGNFVVVHTPSISENLFESEIFGHKKGAFTDAKSDRQGLVAEANGGTLFFDEISEVPISFQTKLLRFIETKKYRILGETREREADVRILAATNRNLLTAIENGEFREDLYFRLHVLEIEIPPLRQRKEDIKTLVLENRKYLNDKELGDGFWEAILNYEWPGNVRELITVLKRAGIMLDGPITGKGIQRIIEQGIFKKPLDSYDDTGKVDMLWEEIKAGKNFWDGLWSLFIDREVDRYVVKKVLNKAFMESSKNFKKMIELLNVDEKDYQKFMSLMYKYKIDPRD
jgi:transcriptional regulator with PAS, ATPase and Fis domain